MMAPGPEFFPWEESVTTTRYGRTAKSAAPASWSEPLQAMLSLLANGCASALEQGAGMEATRVAPPSRLQALYELPSRAPNARCDGHRVGGLGVRRARGTHGRGGAAELAEYLQSVAASYNLESERDFAMVWGGRAEQ